MANEAVAAGTPRGMTPEERRVIFASSLGTMFEWYDFFVYGALAAIFSKQFFAGLNDTAAFIFALLVFAAGFAVRPFGALVFGRLGDLVGRKYTFLVTILIMGASTFLVGLLPTYASVGIFAPIGLVVLRMLQGLAIGGEYGGAATYVAEHAPRGKRGAYTSWIQMTATAGLFLSLIVIMLCRSAMTPEAFDAWGWRVPFLLSVLLLAVSVWIRLRLDESPAFKKMQEEGKGSKTPLRESFARLGNLKIVLLALVGLSMGEAVVWYTGQFYALIFLTQVLKVEPQTATILVAGGLVIGTPFFVIFGVLSDTVGRKPIIMAGCLLAALSYFPIFHAITHYANPALEFAQTTAPVTVVADPADCSLQFNPVGTSAFTSSCDVAKSALVKRGVPYLNAATDKGEPARIRVGGAVIASYDAKAPDAKAKAAVFEARLAAALDEARYPAKAETRAINEPMVMLLIGILVIFGAMTYGPIAAMLVELFPTRIRYSSLSLPYHIGNGWFGGFMPPIAFAVIAATGNMYDGLWYPIVIAGICFVVGVIFLPETKDRDILKD
ncbi:MAG: MHS family MFS transporter [Parvibaculum sp.]|uniref:MFS transporter n=1 Tax=Parvibaculum sp. TaxID=2024848 RepID=UPI0025FE1759|nr:MFS transporter [Parvibaculum sp.]MCE9648362.1 MHS family MFS transporter [Parvibaculum sp.]